MKTKVASGACRRVASSRLSVPLALTAKSVCGSRAAQSCDGCAAVWTTSSSSRRSRRRRGRSPALVADVDVQRAEGLLRVETRASVTGAVDAARRRSVARMSFSIPTTSSPPRRAGDGLRADQAAGARDDRRRPSHHRGADRPSASGDASPCSTIQAWMSASTSRAPRRGRQSVSCARRRAVGDVERNVARAVSAGSRPISTSLPVSSRQSSVVSASDRLQARPPPTLTVAPAQRSGSGELLVDEVDQVVDVQQVAHLLAGRRRSRCRRAAAGSGGRASRA